MTGEVGTIYTLHFNARIGGQGRNGALHYVGWARNLEARLRHHAKGTAGAKITTYAAGAGIGFQVGDLRPGTREDERRLKSNGQHQRRCSICQTGQPVAVAA